jgi:hypothetical protein
MIIMRQATPPMPCRVPMRTVKTAAMTAKTKRIAGAVKTERRPVTTKRPTVKRMRAYERSCDPRASSIPDASWV